MKVQYEEDMAEWTVFGAGPSCRVRRMTLLLTTAQIGLSFYFLALSLQLGPLIRTGNDDRDDGDGDDGDEEAKNNGTGTLKARKGARKLNKGRRSVVGS